MPASTHCTFCDLIHGAAEVSICHEDADAIAFMDIQPVNNGHVLVVPRQHYESLLEVPQELGVHLFQVTMRIASAVRRVTGCEDFNIVVNSGAAAGQDEPHYHVHLIPRRAGDGFDVPLPFDGSEMPDRTVLDAYAARIISALRDPIRIEASSPPSEGGSDAAPEGGVTVPLFTESRSQRRVSPPPESSAPSDPRPGEAHEGAHGELLFEPYHETDDAA
jgi:histidine triad (HIT) family protein